MKVLNPQEVSFVSGGKADFSDVTVTVDSTAEIVNKTADKIEKVAHWMSHSIFE